MRKRTPSPILMFSLLGVAMLSIGWSAARQHHLPLILSHRFAGRTSTCDLAESLEGEALSRLQAGNVAELSAASKVIQVDGNYQLWSTPLGNYWMPKASGDALIYDLSEQKRNIYGTGIRPGDIVLDAGANVGVFVRKSLAAGAGKVIAIEPAPENIECLRRNFAAEVASGQVVIYPKGVWDKEDVLKFAVDPNNSAKDSFVRQLDSPEFISVPVTTVDKLVEELGLPRVDFIKMDIEGSEQKALAGSRGTITRFRPKMAICIYHLANDPVEIPKLVHAMMPSYSFRQACLCTLDRVQPEVAFFN